MPADSPPPPGRDLTGDAFCILFGACLALIVHGYQFGRSNHCVYLLDALRRASPGTLSNDWFLTQTFQYHSVFGWASGWLYRLGVIEPAFLLCYLLLAVGLSSAWYGLMRALGASRLAFLVSAILFYLSAGGTGLGMYQFLQDSALLPSNIAAVAMLWGIYLWVIRRFTLSGLAFGLAGLVHLNYAIVGVGLWVAMGLWDRLLPGPAAGRAESGEAPRVDRGGFWIGSALALAPSLIGIGMALGATLHRSGKMPLNDFIDLYVRLRHPHHYDPSTWPIALWVSFLWVMPFALLFRGERGRAWRECGRFFVLFGLLLIVALVGAGWFYVSETLVQMSLYRLSVFPKLLACAAAGYVLVDEWIRPRLLRWMLAALPVVVASLAALVLLSPDPAHFLLQRWAAVLAFLVALAAPAAYAFHPHGRSIHLLASLWVVSLVIVLWDHGLGVTVPAKIDPDYLAVCDWAKETTPPETLFIVPPDEEAFRLYAERPIVVNFKCVPQLSAELPEWRSRLEEVLDLENLRSLPVPFNRTLHAIRDRYESLSADELYRIARETGARYIVVAHHFGPEHDAELAYQDPNHAFCVYDAGGLRR